MGFHGIPGSDLQYGLIAFDSKGVERPEASGKFSDELVRQVATGPATHVFFFCHGWKGDVPAAIDQYDRWIGALVASPDMQTAKQSSSGFRPIFIGLHWPSLPWGDEKPGNGGAFATDGDGVSADALLDQMTQTLGSTPEIRAQLQVVFDAARTDLIPDTLPDNVRDAYLKLNDALGLKGEGPAAPPDADHPVFDPEAYYQAALLDGANFGGFSLSGILSPLGQLSYWTMKARARTVGETGVHDLLKRLQIAAPSARFHLMGHSFGTIVISGALGGPNCAGKLPRPVDSVALVQGAVSLWSYADRIPFANTGPGYFHAVLNDGKVSGPLITTQSKFDLAVRKLYPAATTIHGNASFGTELPEYGGVGTFGLQGLRAGVGHTLAMQPANGTYSFVPGNIYNIEASEYICKGGGASGAHSDIAGPEVAHAIWQAALQ